MSLDSRKCTLCCVTKHRSDFYANKRYRDGVNYECKSCTIDRSKRWAAENKERRDAYNTAERRAYFRNLNPGRDEAYKNSEMYARRLVVTGTSIDPRMVPTHIVDLKRAHLAAKRELKNLQYELSTLQEKP